MPPQTELRRTLGWVDASNVVVGIVIGAGIFVTPQDLARALPSSEGMFWAWIVSGILVFCGALAFAELSTAFPSTGGLYVYLREAFGPEMAFSSGWIHLFALMSGATAYVAAGFGRYLGSVFSFGDTGQRLLAMLLIGAVALVNAYSTRSSVLVQNGTNFAKLAALVLLIAGALLAPAATQAAPVGQASWGGFSMALASCFFCYEGWSYAGFVAGEMKQPSRDLPRAFAFSFLLIVAVYLLVNLAYLRVLSVEEIQGSAQIGAEVAQRSLGPWGGSLVRATILLAILGSVNGICLAASRLYYAQSKDGLFLPTLDRLDAKRNTPVRAIVIHAVLSCSFLLVPNLGDVLQLAIFAAWLYYFLAVLGLARLRRTRPEHPRPYRMWGYPLTPLLFLAGSGYFLVSLFLQNPWPPAVVFGLLALSFPVARRMQQIKGKSKSAGSSPSLA